jgi:hypothetical protein
VSNVTAKSRNLHDGTEDRNVEEDVSLFSPLNSNLNGELRRKSIDGEISGATYLKLVTRISKGKSFLFNH